MTTIQKIQEMAKNRYLVVINTSKLYRMRDIMEKFRLDVENEGYYDYIFELGVKAAYECINCAQFISCEALQAAMIVLMEKFPGRIQDYGILKSHYYSYVPGRFNADRKIRSDYQNELNDKRLKWLEIVDETIEEIDEYITCIKIIHDENP